MRTAILTVILGLGSLVPICAQDPASLSMFQTPVPGPAQAGGAVVGSQTGRESIYYWVIARTPGGTTSPTPVVVQNTVGAANLTVSNYITISWSAVSGATGYDVVRSVTPVYPVPGTGTCTCAVVLNTALLTVNDQGGALSAYPFVGAVPSVPVQAFLTIDNRTSTNPFVNLQLLSPRYNVTAPLGSGSGIVDWYNNGVLVGSRTKANFVPDTNNTWVMTDDGVNGWVSVQAVPVIPPSTPTITMPLLIGVCTPGGANMGLGWTYAGTNAASTSCQAAWTGSGANDRLNLLYNATNQVSYAHFPVPAGITAGSLTLKFHIVTATTNVATFSAAVGCYAVNSDVTVNLSFTAPASVTFAQAFGTANRLNRGSVVLTSAGIASGNFCVVSLTRTDAAGGNFFVPETWLEFQ